MTNELLPSSEAESEALHARLRAYNHRYYTNLADASYHIDLDGHTVAGIVAGSVCDTLEVEFLFVEEAYRGRGLGKELLLHAEAIARERGLKRMLLNTYSFQAPGFYRRLGYTELCRIEPCFGPHSQYFFAKEL